MNTILYLYLIMNLVLIVSLTTPIRQRILRMNPFFMSCQPFCNRIEALGKEVSAGMELAMTRLSTNMQVFASLESSKGEITTWAQLKAFIKKKWVPVVNNSIHL